MPRRRPKPISLVQIDKSGLNNLVEFPPLTKKERNLLEEVQELLKRMNREQVLLIYDNFISREKDTDLKINIQTEKVPKKDFEMKSFSGNKTSVPSEEIAKLDRDVVLIKSVTVEEDGKLRTPIPMFSEYFYQSSGKSRETNLEGLWLPCGDTPLKEGLPNIKYSKLEDEILETVNLLLQGKDSMDDDEKYKKLFPQFTAEFPTWQSLIQSILKYGRFISETNAMISYKLSSVYPLDKSASKARAKGIKHAKPKKKKGNLKRKSRVKPKPTKKRSKSKRANQSKKKKVKFSKILNF